MEYEKKYTFENCSSHRIIKWLTCMCKKDDAYPNSSVSSIYYDTTDWKYMSEKINSDYLKTKIRIRWYEDIDRKIQYDYSFAEAKLKIGSHREKVRIKIPFSGNWLSSIHLETPQLLQLPDFLKENGVRLRGGLIPTFQINYKRLRFSDPYSGSRICVDYDISTPRVNSVMVPKKNPSRLNTAVFEIKGNTQDLPYSLNDLTLFGCRKESFSKYQACFEKITGISF